MATYTSLTVLLTLVFVSAADEFELCIKEIANTYFNESFVTVIYWRKIEWMRRVLLPNWIHASRSEDNIIRIFSKSGKWAMKIYQGDIEGDLMLKADHRTRNVILLMDSDYITNVVKLSEQIKLSKKIMRWRSQGQILAIIRGKEEEGSVAKGKLVLESLWAFTKACNAVVMVAGVDSVYNMYKWYPYRDDCGEVNRVQLIDTWSNGKFTRGSELFAPNGVVDAYKCPLQIGAFPNPPYVLVPEGDRDNFTDGLDIKIVEELSGLYNFTVNYTTLPVGQFPYVIFDQEGKASGFHGMLQRQELDIMVFGCRIHELRNMLADPLDSYVEDALVWVVPSPRLVPSWRNLGDAFSPTVWIFFGSVFALITVTLYLISNYNVGVVEPPTLRSYVSCVLASLGVLLNNSVASPRSTLLRAFMFMFSLFAINANSAYQSSLVALLTTARHEKPYVTPMDAVMGGVKTYLFPSGNITYNQTDHKMWNIIFQPGRHAYIEDFVPVIREIALNKTAMVMMAENVAEFEIRTKYTTQDNRHRAFSLKEKFSLYRVTAYVSLGHPLRDHFKRKVNQLVEGGLIGYWMEEVLVKSQKISSTHEDEGARPLTLEHLQGAFYILFISLAVTINIFCFEIVIQKISKNLLTQFLFYPGSLQRQ